jgi:nucleotide-binding universal stress UspA family protein
MRASPQPDQSSALRILLAHDLSAASERAADLIASTGWPASTIVRIVTSPVGVGPPPSSFAQLREVRAHSREVREAITEAHDRVARNLREAGLAIETGVIPGKPAPALVAEAERFRADLIAVGARQQGAISATLLGSVSRAVVEDARCSVLVARDSTALRVLLATDGSPAARFATTIVATWPLFAEARITVLGVGESPPSYTGLVLSDPEQEAAFADTIATSSAGAHDTVKAAVQELAVTHQNVESAIRVGKPEREIVLAARRWPADMVVLGSDGASLLRRLVLGSVPRRVLDEVEASVLVARPPITTEARA